MADTSFNFDGPNPVDLNALNAAIEAEAGTQPEAALEAKPAAATPPAAEIPPSVEAQPADPPAAVPQPPAAGIKTHKITVDGQELEVTEADLKSGHMRHRDYTIKTQQIAEERRAIQHEREQMQQRDQAVSQELTQIDQFLRDQDAVRTYMERAFGVSALSTTPPPQVDPNQPITAAQVAQISAYNAEQVRLSNQRQIAEARQEALKAQLMVTEGRRSVVRERAANDIDSHINSLLDKHPILKKFEGIEDELIGDALRFAPRSVEEAKVKLAEAVDRRVATIRAIAADEQKQAAIAQAKLKKNSPEPPGGSAPRADPAKKLTLNTHDRKDLLAAAEADLRDFLGR